MHVIGRSLSRMSLLAVTCLLAVQAQAATQTGSFTFDGLPVHYLVFTGNDESFFQNFKAGGTLTDFENVPGVAPFQATDYTNKTVAANNFVSPIAALNGIFYSSGGQSPGNPANSNNAAPTVLVQLNGIQGAHSGSNVLAPSDFGLTDVKFSESFFSFGVQSADKFSRIGWWTNPLMSTAAGTPNVHAVHSGNVDDDAFLQDLGISVGIQPGDFFAIAFDKPIIQEVEFATAKDHYTLDDVVYSRDNKVTFGVVPEPSSWMLLTAGLGLLFLRREAVARRSSQRVSRKRK
jgi:hypothetical protein